MILALIFLIIIFTHFWVQKKFKRKNFLLSKIPCLPKYPFIHHIPYVFNQKTSDHFYFLVNLGKKLGGIYHLSFGSLIDPYIFVSDAKIVEGFLTSHTELDKGIDYDLLKPWIGTGLVTSTDKKWFQRRKLLTPGFHFQILEKFIEVMERTSDVFISKVESFEDGKTINIYSMAGLFALDTVCECTMGIKLNSQNIDSEYAQAVKEIAHIIMVRTYDPIKRIDFLYQFTKMKKREEKILKFLHGFAEHVIESRREELIKIELDQIKKKTLLDILLTSNIEGVPLTNEDIIEEVNTFLFAGHGTITSALTLILYNIAKYSKVQQKIHDEILRNNEKISLSNLNKLQYLDFVIKETFRMTPPVAFVGRRLKEEVTIEGVTFPKNSNILMSTYIMGHNEKYFEDPEKFNPDRFNVETTYEKINPFSYVPFSAGPRNCIGQKLANLILRSLIYKIVKNYKISLTSNEEPLLCMEIVLRPVKEIFIKFEKR